MEIICVGNELLIGKTLNTNAHWLTKRSHLLGVVVKRITVLRDDIDAIASEISAALKRKPRFIVTTGGLGPTSDDRTIEGIATGLNRKLEVNKEALRMVKKRCKVYFEQGKIETLELTRPRSKMAKLLEGAKPLHNPIGTAPGMMTSHGRTSIFVLPGVPTEMKAIFSKYVAPTIKKKTGGLTFFETSLFVDNIMESRLAPLMDSVMHNNPQVYIKSHVYTKNHISDRAEKSHVELHLTLKGKNAKTAKNRLERAAAQLADIVQKNGGIARTYVKRNLPSSSKS